MEIEYKAKTSEEFARLQSGVEALANNGVILAPNNVSLSAYWIPGVEVIGIEPLYPHSKIEAVLFHKEKEPLVKITRSAPEDVRFTVGETKYVVHFGYRDKQ
jgi:hypothetical protein